MEQRKTASLLGASLLDASLLGASGTNKESRVSDTNRLGEYGTNKTIDCVVYMFVRVR